jgi:hypothetical protein
VKKKEKTEQGFYFCFSLRKPKYYHLSYKKKIDTSSKKKVSNEEVETEKDDDDNTMIRKRSTGANPAIFPTRKNSTLPRRKRLIMRR